MNVQLQLTAGITMLTYFVDVIIVFAHLFCREAIGRLIATKQTA